MSTYVDPHTAWYEGYIAGVEDEQSGAGTAGDESFDPPEPALNPYPIPRPVEDVRLRVDDRDTDPQRVEHEIAVVVFLKVKGVDRRDAAIRGEVVVRDHLDRDLETTRLTHTPQLHVDGRRSRNLHSDHYAVAELADIRTLDEVVSNALLRITPSPSAYPKLYT